MLVKRTLVVLGVALVLLHFGTLFVRYVTNADQLRYELEQRSGR